MGKQGALLNLVIMLFPIAAGSLMAFFVFIGLDWTRDLMLLVIGSCIVGLSLLLWIKIQSFRQGVVFSFGPSALSSRLRKWYYVAYMFLALFFASAIGLAIVINIKNM